jgi:MFS family permease
MAIPFTGWLIGRFGSKRVTVWSTAGFSVALAVPALTRAPLSLFCALLLYGAMAGANDVSINSQAVAVEAALGSATMSRFHAMFSIGGMIGASAGSLAAAHTLTPGVHLLTASALFLSVSALTAPFLLDARESSRQGTAKVEFQRIPKVLATLTVIGFCLFLSEGAIADWAAVYLKQVLSAGSGMAAAGYAVFSAGMAIFRLLGDWVANRFGPVHTVRTAALAAALGLTWALTAHSAEMALPGLGLTGAGFSVIVPLVFSAGGRIRCLPAGAGVALVSGAGYVAFLFGPPLIGFLAHWSSLRAALFLVVALSVLAASLARAVGDSDEARGPIAETNPI